MMISSDLMKSQQLLATLLKRTFTCHKSSQQIASPFCEIKDARPHDEIPSPPKQMFLGHINLLAKNMKIPHIFHEEMRKKYGNIVRFSIPGDRLVFVYGPEQGREMYSSEGKYPMIGGFENHEFFR